MSSFKPIRCRLLSLGAIMKRREFITLIGGAAATWPLAARAQQAGKQPTIGFLGGGTSSAQSLWTAAFEQRLRELGWIEGRTIAIEYRWAEGRSDHLADIAAEFVRLKVDVIVTHSAEPVLAAKRATSVIPIVFGAAADPVGRLTASFCSTALMSVIGRYCCKSRKSNNPKNLAEIDLWTSLLLRRFSMPLRRSGIDFG